MIYDDLTKTASGRSALAMILAALAGVAGGYFLGNPAVRRDVGNFASGQYRTHLQPLVNSGATVAQNWYNQDLAPALNRGGQRTSDWYQQQVAPQANRTLNSISDWANREVIPRADSTWSTIRGAYDRAFRS